MACACAEDDDGDEDEDDVDDVTDDRGPGTPTGEWVLYPSYDWSIQKF